MPETKKNAKPQPRNYDSPLDSQIDGVRLVPTPGAKPETGQLSDVQAPPPDLVSKLIDFIKKI